MLLAGPYPWMLKQRIRGDARAPRQSAPPPTSWRRSRIAGLRGVVLAHLSEVNNSGALAVGAVSTALRRAGRAGRAALGQVVAAAQREPLGPVRAQRRAIAQLGQFELTL